MPSLVSVCVPSCERTAFLIEAVRSCLEQTYDNIEILIGDDSRTDRVKQALELFGRQDRIRYFHNESRLGQAENINRLVNLARGDRIVLLHDDDALVPDAVELLDRCWQDNPGVAACYGKSYVMTNSGVVLDAVSTVHNRRRSRDQRHRGLQTSPLWCCLVGQFPSDGYMVQAAAARATAFRSTDEVGDSCDLDFALRLAQRSQAFYFVDSYISKYRFTDNCVSTRPDVEDRGFFLIRDLCVPAELEAIKQRNLALSRRTAIRLHLARGERAEAWKLMSELQLQDAAVSPGNVALLVLLRLPSWISRAVLAARYGVLRVLRRWDLVFQCVAWAWMVVRRESADQTYVARNEPALPRRG